MKDERREDLALTTKGMIKFMWRNYTEWIAAYLERFQLKSLEKMCQRIANRNGFSTQKPQEGKMTTEKLMETRATFAADFWSQYAAFEGDGMYNVDETAINFDVPPARIWAKKGRKDSARIANYTKKSGRLTAVLTVRADGKKLPILFIVRGKLGGTIDCEELSEYPQGHFYTVQENAWMDSVGWNFYVNNVLKHEISGPALLLLDNFDCHVSEEGQRVVAEDACATVVPLPPNSTAFCQPLDVGVMGPLKAKIRANYSGASGGTAKEKRIRAIKATIAAWDEITEATVIASFKAAIPRVVEATV